MLQNMRERMQGIIAAAIVSIIALTFALWGVQNYLHSVHTASAVAKVNGVKITQEQLRIAHERAKRQQMMKDGADYSLDQKKQAELKKQVLQDMIKNQILMQATGKMGLGVSAAQLEMAITMMPIFQSNGVFSANRFQQVLSNLFYSEHEFINEVKSSLVMMQLEKGIVDSEFVLPDELETAQKVLNQHRDIGYFVINSQRFANAIQVSTSDIQAYYKQNQNEFISPEKISIEYVQLSANDLKAKIQITPTQLQQFYQEHIDSFSTPKRWQITKIVLPVVANADAKTLTVAKEKINNLAKQLQSETAAQVKSPSNTGVKVETLWTTRKELAPEYASHVDKLAIGSVSEPFMTKDGYNVIKVLATEESKVKPYAEVADAVKKQLEQQQLMQMFSELNDKLSDLTYTTSDSLQSAVTTLNLPLKTTNLFSRDGEKTGILANPKVVTAAFSDQVLKQKYNSNAIEIDSGNIVVLRLKDHVAESVKPLEQVRPIIEQKLRTMAMKKNAQDLAKKILELLQNGQSPQNISQQYNLKWQSVTNISRKDKELNPKILQSAFELPQPVAERVSAKIIDLGDEGSALVEVNAVYPGAVQKAEIEPGSNFYKGLQETIGMLNFSMLVDDLTKTAKVKIEEEK